MSLFYFVAGLGAVSGLMYLVLRLAYWIAPESPNEPAQEVERVARKVMPYLIRAALLLLPIGLVGMIIGWLLD